MKISLPAIGKRLRKAREEKGFSIADAERVTGYSKSKLRRIEREGTRDLLTIADLCNAYGADIRLALFGARFGADSTPLHIKNHIIQLARYYEQSAV